MSDQNDQTPPPDREGDGPAQPEAAGRLGRRLGMLAFWCLALYLAVVGFRSIGQQVLFPEVRGEPSGTCGEALASLRAELLDRSAAHAKVSGRRALPSLDRWLRRWDERHRALEATCRGPGAAPHRALARLRHRIDASLRQQAREQAPLLDQVDEGLRALATHNPRTGQ